MCNTKTKRKFIFLGCPDGFTGVGYSCVKIPIDLADKTYFSKVENQNCIDDEIPFYPESLVQHNIMAAHLAIQVTIEG